MAFPWNAVAIAGGSALDFTGGFYSNHMNYVNQKRANEQNYQMFQEQLAFDREMWEKTNEYNSPANQRKLLEQAGFNPELFFDGNGTSTASTQSAPNGSPSLAPQTNNPFAGAAAAGASIGNAILQQAQADNINEDTKARAMDNLYKIALNQSRLENDRADLQVKLNHMKRDDADYEETLRRIKSLDQQIALGEEMGKYNSSIARARNQREQLEVEESQERISTMKFERALSAERFDLERRLNSAQVNQIFAIISDLNNQSLNRTKLTSAQVNELSWSAANQLADCTLKTVKNDAMFGNDARRQRFVKSMQSELTKAIYESDTRGWKDVINVLSSWIPFAPGMK